MPDYPWVSCIIPTYGAKGVDLTRKCVTTLKQTHAHILPEIVIVSDGDDEDVMEQLKALCIEEGMPLARIERNGFAAACNAGLRVANGQLAVYLINNDIEFEVNTLQITTDAMLTMNAGIVGCLLLYPDRKIQHAGVVYVPSNNPSVPGYFDHFLRFENEKHIDAVVLRSGLVTGALMGISRNFIERSGYLDERFGFTCEDVDLCLRSYECGMPPLYCGYTYAIHHEGASRGKTLEEKMALEPEVAAKEARALEFIHRKYIGLEWTKFSVPNPDMAKQQ